MRERILTHCRSKFLAEGFSKTSMDEIAAELKISKKTIYKHFPSKSELVMQTIQGLLYQKNDEIVHIINSEQNVIEKLKGIFDALLSLTIQISTKFLEDVRITEPEIWDFIDKFRTKAISENVSRIFEQGIQEKLFLPYPPEIILTIFSNGIRSIIHPDFILNNNFSIRYASQTALDIIIRGTLSKKGRKIYKHIAQVDDNEDF